MVTCVTVPLNIYTFIYTFIYMLILNITGRCLRGTTAQTRQIPDEDISKTGVAFTWRKGRRGHD